MKPIPSAIIIITIVALYSLIALVSCEGAEIDEKQAIRAIIGEASNQGYEGMLAVACGIRNRGSLKGVYGLRAKHVQNEPEWVFKEAKRAWVESEVARVHKGTHWENVRAFGEPYWVKDMVEVYRVGDHVFYREVE